jgi:hypothetical protein
VEVRVLFGASEGPAQRGLLRVLDSASDNIAGARQLLWQHSPPSRATHAGPAPASPVTAGTTARQGGGVLALDSALRRGLSRRQLRSLALTLASGLDPHRCWKLMVPSRRVAAPAHLPAARWGGPWRAASVRAFGPATLALALEQACTRSLRVPRFSYSVRIHSAPQQPGLQRRCTRPKRARLESPSVFRRTLWIDRESTVGLMRSTSLVATGSRTTARASRGPSATPVNADG